MLAPAAAMSRARLGMSQVAGAAVYVATAPNAYMLIRV